MSRAWSIKCCASDASTVMELNMNSRFSSSSAEERPGRCLGKMVAPFLVQLHELVKFRLKVVRRVVRLRLFQISRSAGGSASSAGSGVAASSLVSPTSSTGFFAQLNFRAFDFFEDGILLELLFDERLEFERGRLQQRQ
jgi:hypothetical protein